MVDVKLRGYKPLGRKSYGHIPHLPGSRIGPGDHKCSEGQARIATEKCRDRLDRIIVQEKLDGSNMGVARIGDDIVALMRSGYPAQTSRWEQHQRFAQWVRENRDRFLAVLRDDERLCGEWLMQAHGTRYRLWHEPLVVFDLMRGEERLLYSDFVERIALGNFISPHVLHEGGPLSIVGAMQALNTFGFHGALDPVEGAVWRVERNAQTNPNSGTRSWRVDFLVKYVRPDKIDGRYLPEVSRTAPVFNWSVGIKSSQTDVTR